MGKDVETDAYRTIAEELVAASRILAHKEIVDGFGHVSVRFPGRADRFLISRSKAPALVTPEDIMVMDLAGEAIHDDRPAFIERFIHAAVYRVRPDVGAVVHSHSPSVIPFGVVASAPLRPIFHMCAHLGEGAPVFEIRDTAGPASDMLIRDMALGQALAERLGAGSTVLMRGHGSTVVGPTLQQAVYRAVYLEVNARIQLQAQQLGPVNFLNAEEAANTDAFSQGQVGRTWELWLRELDIRTSP